MRRLMMSRLIWIYAVYKGPLLSPVAVKIVNVFSIVPTQVCEMRNFWKICASAHPGQITQKAKYYANEQWRSRPDAQSGHRLRCSYMHFPVQGDRLVWVHRSRLHFPVQGQIWAEFSADVLSSDMQHDRHFADHYFPVSTFFLPLKKKKIK